MAAVLASAQCLKVCAFTAHGDRAPVPQTQKPEMPCHQKSSHPETPAPQGFDQCSHHEMLGEKRVSATSPDESPRLALSVASEPAAAAAGPAAPVHTPFKAGPPRLVPGALSAVLRV